jgi:hypothetical protein
MDYFIIIRTILMLYIPAITDHKRTCRETVTWWQYRYCPFGLRVYHSIVVHWCNDILYKG